MKYALIALTVSASAAGLAAPVLADLRKPVVRTFYQPKLPSGKRLDWCATWAANCGGAAADAFCGDQGYDEAAAYSIAADIGLTELIGTGQICSGTFCDGFASIKCVMFLDI